MAVSEIEVPTANGNRKPVPLPIPVHFRPVEAGNFAIFDNGGDRGDHRPYLFAGEIVRSDAGRWFVYADGALLAGNLETFSRAKDVYLAMRESIFAARDNATPVAPRAGWCDVLITCAVWERADAWRAVVFAAMLRAGHRAPEVQTMLRTPRVIEASPRGPVYVARLPDPIAAHLRQAFPEDAEIRG